MRVIRIAAIAIGALGVGDLTWYTGRLTVAVDPEMAHDFPPRRRAERRASFSISESTDRIISGSIFRPETRGRARREGVCSRQAGGADSLRTLDASPPVLRSSKTTRSTCLERSA